ncbi:Mechanosensory protein 2, partial [Fasciola gigantica]
MHPVDEACSVNGIYTSSTVPTRRTQTGYNSSSNHNFNVRSEINRDRSVSETASPLLDVRNTAINEVSLSASNSTGYGNQRYENSDGQNISNNTPIRCLRTNTNFVTEAITQPHSEAGNVSVSSETKATASKPRVSFDEDSNTTEYTVDVPQNYEDVVTLRIPSKETSRFSCRRSHQNWKRSSLRWFHKTYHTAASPNPARWSWLRGKSDKNRQPGDEMEAKPNGNHLKSIYENENEERRSDFEEKFSEETKNLDPNRGPVSPKSDFYRICTGHDWEANQGAKSGDDSDNNNNNNKNSMVWTTNFLAALSIFLIILTFPFSLIYCIRIVAEYERAVVLRMGNLIPKGKGTKGPGLFFILPCIDSVRKVDLRTITFAIPPQELLTRDSVTVSVDAVVYYRVLNPVASVLNIEDAARSTRLLAQTTIRNVLGTKDLAQILMDRDEISILMQSNLDATTDAWGVK